MPYCLKRWLLSRDWANDFSIPCVWLIFPVVVFSFDMILLAQSGRSLSLSLWTGRAMRITIEVFRSLDGGRGGGDDDNSKTAAVH